MMIVSNTFTGVLLVASGLLASTDAATEFSATVYEGPKECDDSEKVKAGMHLTMHYTGTIDQTSETGEKGKKFDSSRDRGQTFDFQIGQGMVIPGWDKGLIGLCKGAKATLVIPPDMGYGASGAGADIPGGATLNFDVEVVDISDEGPPQPNLFAELDVDGDGKLTKEEIQAFFGQRGQEMPPEVWESEDKDKDGFVTWEEFGGPKGNAPPGSKDEL
uniref:peptidylprolyl isomerase n=1 Tax=Grammatophora oceanica TaxID=210454 RepID=A0A7S1VHK8_9STRA|mmetsp:Transcript_46758/g.69540  ORF Transcript_46758/g.69540 Transcript_46758/m.69540 type:complete len:217 (+) Transcript_46758:152-802(+)|eukprot:CAMPEP_0194047236 /NCGR_PEP_ID=MMETSP0009_2-20130614/23644_1 /TAXON_ID=210454 /ORGANISM="Grammatophora oceanica, Strain CCMP 410" /LENGTH=216 /DNA_ID=CAMNT_0038692785 /DNA_START=136 /DNA_END=786 /DNA_ORIENTATION=+